MPWISKNNYLSLSEMQNNAVLVRDYLYARGWSINAISGMLGNMQSESNINPGIWESLTVNYSRGYGLVQWTPATKYIDWANEQGLQYDDGYSQLQRIIYEKDNGLQWFENPAVTPSEPPISFAEFSVSTLPVATLADYFIWYYEHPADPFQPARATQAEYWFEYLTGIEPQPPEPPTPTGGKVPIWLLYKFNDWRANI